MTPNQLCSLVENVSTRRPAGFAALKSRLRRLRSRQPEPGALNVKWASNMLAH